MGTAQRQGELWGRAADRWAAGMEPHHRPLWEAMLDAAAVGGGSKVLDAGCGGGGASTLMAERGVRVSGIDAAEGLIALARERLPGGDFRVGDIEALPFPAEAFDVVFAASSLQFAADRVATLRGFARVCRPGGRIVVGLFGPEGSVAYSLLLRAVRSMLPEPPSGGPFELSRAGVLDGLFAEAGFEVTGRGEVDCPFRFADLDACWRAVSSAGPVQAAMHAVGEGVVRASVLEAARVFLVDDGSVDIGPNVFVHVVATV